MLLPERAVIVRQLPQACAGKEGKAFLRELADAIALCIRPNVVLDCSRVPAAAGDVIHLLMCCLEEAMKRNGDVRLSAVCPDSRAALDSAGLGRLFKVFGSTPEAVQSYRRPAIGRPPLSVSANADQPAANAA